MKRIAMLLGVAALLGGLYWLGAFDLLGDPEQAKQLLESLGVWGPILYVSAFALLEPFFVPGVAFIIPGALVFSFPMLLFLSWLGSTGAGIVGFSFARYLGRDYVEQALPPAMRRFDERLAERGLQTVILVRLLFFLAPPAHWLLGLSRVPFTPFLIGTAIGLLPGLAALSYLFVFMGESMGGWLAEPPLALIGGSALLAVVLFAIRRQLKRRSGENAVGKLTPR